MQCQVTNKSQPSAEGYKLIFYFFHIYGHCLQLSFCRSTFVLSVGIWSYTNLGMSVSFFVNKLCPLKSAFLNTFIYIM